MHGSVIVDPADLFTQNSDKIKSFLSGFASSFLIFAVYSYMTEKILLPREKLLEQGVAALSDYELMSILLGSGVAGMSVFDMAEKLLHAFDSHEKPELDTFLSLKGIGQSKACQILAAYELMRRRLVPHEPRIRQPEDIYHAVRHFSDRKQEHFLCLSLNGAHEIIKTRVVSIGLVNKALVHPREVFAEPLKDRACAIAVAHNHPSGNLEASEDDKDVTKRLRDAGFLLGISLLDHVIFSKQTYFSFLEAGDL